MTAPKPSVAVADDRVLSAFDSAVRDDSVLAPDEAAALDEQMAAGEARIAAGERPFRTAEEVTADLARSKE